LKNKTETARGAAGKVDIKLSGGSAITGMRYVIKLSLLLLLMVITQPSVSMATQPVISPVQLRAFPSEYPTPSTSLR